MTYLTIPGAGGAPRRVDFAQFAVLFAEPEAPAPPPPSRGLPRLAAVARMLADGLQAMLARAPAAAITRS